MKKMTEMEMEMKKLKEMNEGNKLLNVVPHHTL